MDGWIVGVREVSRRERGFEEYFLLFSSLLERNVFFHYFSASRKPLIVSQRVYSTVLYYTVKEVLPKEHHRIDIKRKNHNHTSDKSPVLQYNLPYLT